MGEKTRVELEDRFETGDIPLQVDFTDLFDSYPNILDDGVLVGGDDGLIAFAGGGQGSATPLTKKVNRIVIVASVGDSVLLPSAVAGMDIMIENSGVNSMDVFPRVGQIIAGLGLNNPLAVGAGIAVIIASPINSGWIQFNSF